MDMQSTCMETHSTLRIVLVVDFICPWSYLALKRLQSAMEKVLAASPSVHFDLQLASFQLNPNMPTAGVDRKAYRSQKFGSWEKSLEREKAVQAASTDVGLTFDFGKIKFTPNTELAHRVLQITNRQGVGVEFGETVFEAYFQAGVNIGDLRELLRMAVSVGVSNEVVMTELGTASSQISIRENQHDWLARGIRGVPLMVVPTLNLEIPGVVTVPRIVQLLCQGDTSTNLNDE